MKQRFLSMNLIGVLSRSYDLITISATHVWGVISVKMGLAI